jgi:DNA-binding transcriptional LysR family regulator
LLVLPSGHRLAGNDAIFLKEVADQPFVMYPTHAGTGLRPLILRLCREAGFAPHIAQEANEALTIIGLVAAGCGISVLPGSFDTIHMEGVCYRPIADPDAVTTLYLARRSDATSPLIAGFVALAMENS